jgi:ribosomal-protein-alanine acetyltransferase
VTAPEPRPAVRSASEGDLDRIARLEEMAFEDPWPREMLAYELAHPHAVLLVASRSEGGPPDAYAAFRHAAGEAELLRIGVDPEARRTGLARALLVEGLERLLRLEVQVCFLEVRVDNASAIRLYESLGFSCTGHRKGYYRDGTDALIFVLGI